MPETPATLAACRDLIAEVSAAYGPAMADALAELIGAPAEAVTAETRP